MTNSILLLALIGLALAVLHIPSVVAPLVIIGGLVFFSIKLFWSMMQLFSSSSAPNPTSSGQSA